MYSTCTFTPGSDQCGNYSSVCDCYNREHSLPKSWFGGSTSNAPGNDLFHLVPTDGKVNSQRSNHPFGECSGGEKESSQALGKLGSSTLSGYTNMGTVFEPDDLYKGDFARGYFGMIVRYGTSYAFTKDTEGKKMFNNSSCTITAANQYGLTNYSVALLMKWTRQDPVSPKETARNTGIQATQGNRNPFIDCPILTEYLWGNKSGQSVSRTDLVDCGCIDAGSGGTALEDVIEEETEEASTLASVSITPTQDGFTLTCLPVGAKILIFNVQGHLLSEEKCIIQEMSIQQGKGLYMVVLAHKTETRSIKIIL